MKKLYLILLIVLLLCAEAFPADIGFCRKHGGVATAPTYACTDATHDSANNAVTSCENFDGATTCTAGYTDNCLGSWLVGSGTPDYDNTTNKTEGTYSVFLDVTGANGCFIYKSISAGANYYGYAHIKVVALPSISRQFITFNTDGAVRLQINIGTTGKLKVFHGTSNAETTSGLSAGNTYAVWYGYNQGTGANGYAYVAWALVTGGTPPAKPALCDPSGTTCADGNSAVVDNGSQTTTVNRAYFGYAATDTTLQFSVDHVRVNTTDFGSNVP